MNVSTESFYWASRLLGALADSHFNVCNIHIERYQNALMNQGHLFFNENDALTETSDLKKANEKMAEIAKRETDKALNNVLYEASCHMKNGYSRSDN